MASYQFQLGNGQVTFCDARLCADMALCDGLSLLNDRVDGSADSVDACVTEGM